MTRWLVLLGFVTIIFCAIAQVTPESSLSAPRHPIITGNVKVVSVADVRAVLTLARKGHVERHWNPVPIDRAQVIDRNTISLHYWMPGRDMWVDARRVQGHWRLDYADKEIIHHPEQYRAFAESFSLTATELRDLEKRALAGDIVAAKRMVEYHSGFTGNGKECRRWLAIVARLEKERRERLRHSNQKPGQTMQWLRKHSESQHLVCRQMSTRLSA
jgi:hypothetical protein